ncbi:hypothetical protein AXE80_00285 [Wenyingzhuangia fucanilytica]|uniref:DUF4294 domain-containing protein n=1 Tax=Wenyingzhuangia fucanilytica TaxID=1790137 RepID=A0A1B1Y231_9FLAO|nr:hypothetical protein [Wenyingzhuangia fucanilytica]ANW94824.1 hypothetical protein AXE80_00285 [Wenyingzhuangia fucanilytica]
MYQKILIVLLLVAFQNNLSAQDFLKSKWGDSKSEVISTITDKYILEDSKIYVINSTIADLAIDVVYHFENDKLVHGVLSLKEKLLNEEKYKNSYRALKEVLIKKYGEPITDRSVVIDELYNYSDLGKHHEIQRGDLKYYTEWEHQKTEIKMFLGGVNNQISMTLNYKVIGGYEALDEEKKIDIWDKL